MFRSLKNIMKQTNKIYVKYQSRLLHTIHNIYLQSTIKQGFYHKLHGTFSKKCFMKFKIIALFY